MSRTAFTFLVALVLCLVSEANAGDWQPSLRGSRAALLKQNEIADKAKLTRIADDAMLARFKKGGFLVPLPASSSIVIDGRLDGKWRWCRPWTRKFLGDLAREHLARFRRPLQINSAVRTAVRQHQLDSSNANAAAASGPRTSSHLTGATVDIAKLPMNREQLRWMRERLLALEHRGLIEATEEHRQAVFHVMVFPPKAK